jgi:hypothetical protein
VIANKSDAVLRNLDCPIDSFVIKNNNLDRISLLKLDLEGYEKMQKALARKYEMKILADIKAWDSKKGY